MDAFWAVPEWAPADESHLLGSSSVVTKISYGKGSVTYSTFDSKSLDVLRLNFDPATITIGGRIMQQRQVLDHEGFTYDKSSRVLRILHEGSGDVDIQGESNIVPPIYVTFDDPHQKAGTVLVGDYPAGVIDWGEGTWQIATPQGKFGTFTLTLKDPKAEQAAFRFRNPRVFAGVDVYNGGSHEATVTVHCPEIREISFKIKPGELRRLKTGWKDRSSTITFDLAESEGLRFDNLAYHY
jgi:hypothetical protein